MGNQKSRLNIISSKTGVIHSYQDTPTKLVKKLYKDLLQDSKKINDVGPYFITCDKEVINEVAIYRNKRMMLQTLETDEMAEVREGIKKIQDINEDLYYACKCEGVSDVLKIKTMLLDRWESSRITLTE